MMTFKELKKLVKLPLYKEQRVPTVKALEESGVSVVAEKILENHGSISVYQNGYVIYRAHKRVTVFSLRNCVHYKYDALEGAGHHIEEEEFDEYEWHIRLVLEGEDRIFMNYEIIQGKWMPSREDREYREEILEGVDEAVSTLERIKSIGFSLEDGSIYSGMFDLMVGGEVQAEIVNHIQHYRESPLVQKAISDMKTLLEKRQASKELEERPSTRQSVREALKNRKKAQEQQSNQEQAKPKKAKKKGEMEL
jgi:hypothetical protein